MTDDERIAEIRARLTGITPGKWRGCKEFPDVWTTVDGVSDMICVGMAPNDRDFIAHAPEDIDTLLKHIDALQAQIEKFEEKLSDMEDDARGRWV